MPILRKEQLDYITAVTGMLNGTVLPKSNEYGIKVVLVDKETDILVARWEDTHGDNDWGLELLAPSKSEEDRVA